MQTNALKLMRGGTANPIASPPPVEPVKPVEPAKQETPVEPVPAPVEPVEKPVFKATHPANDPFMGLVSGAAPDPSTEIPAGPEPVKPVQAEDAPAWKPKILELESAKEDTAPRYIEMDASGGVVSISNMAEAEFVEWWAIDVWEALAGIAAFIPGINLDLSALRTKEEDYEQARVAAKHLYKLALRNPKWLGWMISDNNVAVGDWLFCVAFFGSKALVAISIILEKKREWVERKKQKKEDKARNRSNRSNQSEKPVKNRSNQSKPVEKKGKADG